MKPTTLEEKLGLRFRDKGLLDLAMVHPSLLNELPPAQQAAGSYERLEFLGDAVLGLAVTLQLFTECPQLPEGELTKLRSSLVSGTTLANVASRLELGQYLKLGRGEEATGGRDRASNLEAALEALVGALFLDQGFDPAREFVVRVLEEEIGGLLADGVPDDPKSRLQEVAQGMGETPPSYRLIQEGGPDHSKSFQVEAVLGGRVIGRGRGKRKLEAEREAAREALRGLEVSTGP